MIQKGIIAQVIDRYTYKVRIPKYDKLQEASHGTRTEDLASGIVCTIPGIDLSYSVNDVVLVSFENDELSKPIILGLLYRDHNSNSDISVSNVDSSLGDIQNNINELNNTKLFTHLKYSNDNGLTFTSLFSGRYYEVSEGSDIFCRPYFDDEKEIKGVKIDKKTRVINWSIIDDNNVDISSNIDIETTIFDSSGNIIRKVSKDEHLSNIVISNSSQIDGDLYLDYKIFTSKEYLDTLHVSLTTDKDILGTIQGDYLGIYISNDSSASLIPSDYHWVSFNESLQNYMSELRTEINIDLNEKILDLREEIEENLVEIYYKSVEWTQSEVDLYCQPGYTDTWTRDLVHGYTGEIKEGNILYITVHNTGSGDSLADDSYGRLQIKAINPADENEPVFGEVIYYDISTELAINALARFKSSLLAPGDETLIYGGHITTGYIQDSTGKNFIQLSTEPRARAGHLEFKNESTWESSTSGIQWRTYIDENEVETGTLSVKGNIVATSGNIGGAVIENGILQIDNINVKDGAINANKLNIGDYITFGYVMELLLSEPSGWSTNFGDYYEETFYNSKQYRKLDTYSVAPTWEPNKYYRQTNIPSMVLGGGGDEYDDFSISINNRQIEFLNGAQVIAYMKGSELWIPQSVMLDQMKVGDNKWSWRVHGKSSNLELKWIGE